VASNVVELSRVECLELLATHRVGRLAIVMSNRSPAIRPVNYVFDRSTQSVTFRTGRGSKLSASLHAAKAAVEIDGIEAVARSGWSVVVEGATARVSRPDGVARLNRLELQPWASGSKPHWVEIRARSVSGRRIVSR
jgi:nitroimidazol reductase NimA-like FMN-containing flavoprotein (pyridoxamine 5'-phosphate oxidase superfamily)